ncbi:hypothetical protein ZWY2020_058591 [Hordeum vulgare]|nr:hypothetical protein ZWY2020_058591 [Hordeum vulgare]
MASSRTRSVHGGDTRESWLHSTGILHVSTLQCREPETQRKPGNQPRKGPNPTRRNPTKGSVVACSFDFFSASRTDVDAPPLFPSLAPSTVVGASRC